MCVSAATLNNFATETAVQADLFELQTKDIFSSRTYAEFREKLFNSNCPKCSELCAGRTHIVVDRGNPGTKVVFIGEAPGENEDLQGKSFVGRAGKLLDQILESMGLDSNRDTLILNVVKCRPPGNRAPKPEEAANCLPYLRWQLDFVKPRVVALLGATAARYFLPHVAEGGMKESVGKFFDAPDYPGIKFQVLYHPAYLLRDPRKKKDMWEHVKELGRVLEGEKIFVAGRKS